MRSTTFCSENLPICGAPDSVTLPDDIELSAKEVFCLHLGDDLPNEPALFIGRRRLSSSQEDWEMYCQTCRVLGRTFFSPRAACFASYLDPKSAKVPVKQCPYGQQTNSKSSQTESGGGGSNQGTFVTGYGGSSSSHLVTGLGRFGDGGGGDDDPLRPRPVKLTPSHYAEFAGYEEEQPMDSQRRLLVTTTPEEILAAPMAFFGCSDNHSPCDATGTTPPASYFMDEIAVTPIEQSNSDIGDSFDLMSRLQTRAPTTPQQQCTLGFIPGPFSPPPSPSTPLPLSPVTPLNPSPVTPIPSPAPVSPQVTTTPQQASASGPARLFHPKTYVTDVERVCETGLKEEVTVLQQNKAALEGEVTALQQVKAGLEGQVTVLWHNKAGLEGEVTNLQQGKAGLEGQVNALQQCKAGLEGQVTILLEKKNGLEGQVTALQRGRQLHYLVSPLNIFRKCMNIQALMFAPLMRFSILLSDLLAGF